MCNRCSVVLELDTIDVKQDGHYHLANINGNSCETDGDLGTLFAGLQLIHICEKKIILSFRIQSN